MAKGGYKGVLAVRQIEMLSRNHHRNLLAGFCLDDANKFVSSLPSFQSILNLDCLHQLYMQDSSYTPWTMIFVNASHVSSCQELHLSIFFLFLSKWTFWCDRYRGPFALGSNRLATAIAASSNYQTPANLKTCSALPSEHNDMDASPQPTTTKNMEDFQEMSCGTVNPKKKRLRLDFQNNDSVVLGVNKLPPAEDKDSNQMLSDEHEDFPVLHAAEEHQDNIGQFSGNEEQEIAAADANFTDFPDLHENDDNIEQFSDHEEQGNISTTKTLSPGYASSSQLTCYEHIIPAPTPPVHFRRPAPMPPLRITEIRTGTGRQQTQLTVATRYGGFDTEDNRGPQFATTNRLQADCIDAGGTHLITVWMYDAVAADVGAFFIPGKHLSMRNFFVHPKDPRFHRGNWPFAIQVLNKTIIEEIQPVPIILRLAETNPTLDEISNTMASNTYVTVIAAIVGIAGQRGNHQDIYIADSLLDTNEYTVQFFYEMDRKFDELKSGFFKGDLPVKVFHNVQTTREKGTFRITPCTIIYDLHDCSIKNQLKLVARTFDQNFTGSVGTFTATAPHEIGPVTLCSVCKKAFNTRITQETVYCQRCKMERPSFRQLTIYGALQTADSIFKISMRDIFADQKIPRPLTGTKT